MKTFQVLVTAYRTVLIQVEDDEGMQEAAETASENCTSFSWEIDEWKVEKELTSPEQILNSKRHGAVDMDDF